jgi:hypothetical protein
LLCPSPNASSWAYVREMDTHFCPISRGGQRWKTAAAVGQMSRQEESVPGPHHHRSWTARRPTYLSPVTQAGTVSPPSGRSPGPSARTPVVAQRGHSCGQAVGEGLFNADTMCPIPRPHRIFSGSWCIPVAFEAYSRTRRSGLSQMPRAATPASASARGDAHPASRSARPTDKPHPSRWSPQCVVGPQCQAHFSTSPAPPQPAGLMIDAITYILYACLTRRAM